MKPKPVTTFKVGDKVRYNSIKGYALDCVVVLLALDMVTVKEPVSGKYYFARIDRIEPLPC
jgi:hypothetical protein